MSSTTTQTAPAATKLTGSSELEYIPRGPVESTLQFYASPEDGSSPFQYVEDPPEGQPKRNFGDADIKVEITDIRGRETDFTLDRNAFETLMNVNSAMSYKDFEDDSKVQKIYYPEVESLLLKHVPGVNRVLIFDHTIRRANPSSPRAPVTRTHIDQTPSSAVARVHHHLPAEAEELLKGRYRIINVWRPINGAVQSFPLAFADSASVRDEDLVGIEHRYPDRTGETAGVKYNPGQQWHYWSGMDNDERLLLKCYDSDETVIQNGGSRVPHTAFIDPRTPEEGKPRESIEVRALVFG